MRAAHRTLAASAALALLLAAAPSPAETAPFHHTGDAVLKANHWPFTVELFSVSHEMRDLPAEKSRRAVVDFDTDKRLALHVLHRMSAERLTGWISDEYDRNGYRDAERIRTFVGAFGGSSAELQEGDVILIQYDAAAKTTTVTVGKRKPVPVNGLDFMRATWTVWFNRALGDGLVKSLS